jgi:hypothetical protein
MPSTFAMRAFVYVPSAPLTNVARVLLQAMQGADPFTGYHLAVLPSLKLVMNDWASPMSLRESSTTYPIERWTCLELRVAPNKMTILQDGTTVSDLSSGTWATPAVSWTTFNYQLGQWPDTTAPASDIWMDDVVIAEGPIGCD